jgi:hypothetical protein
MSLRKRRPLGVGLTVVFFFCLQGCVQESSEPPSPLSGGNHSNVSVSGYMRSGVMFSGH